MAFRSIALIAVLILACSLQAQPAYQLQYPFSQSAQAGASFHLLLHHEFSGYRNYLLLPSVFRGDRLVSSAGNVAYRLLLLGTVDFYMAYLSVVNQHEYFGHLGRAKQQNAGFTRYRIFFFPPTGGIAYYGDHQYHPLTVSERLLEVIGGLEANDVMSEEIRQNIIQACSMNFNTSMFFLGARSDLVTYLFFEEESSTNDIGQYLQLWNLERSPGASIEKNDLLMPAMLSFLSSPFVIQTSYRLIHDYVFRGKEESELILFNKDGRVKFLPYTSYTLTPVGPVISLENYFIRAGQHYKFSIGHGFPWRIRRFECRFSSYRIPVFTGSLLVDLDLRVWHGEAFRMHDRAGNLISSGKFGGLASVDLFHRLPLGSWKGRIPMIMGGIYLKSNGYTAGYRLHKGVGFRIGAGYFFGA